ncbi:MAG: hypothetical protein M1570_05185 [Chloroflexi bacterium]|nr:hypothetical protein [Chloroflexota bacterium]
MIDSHANTEAIELVEMTLTKVRNVVPANTEFRPADPRRHLCPIMNTPVRQSLPQLHQQEILFVDYLYFPQVCYANAE